MQETPGPENGRLGGFAAGTGLSTAALFELLWNALADLLGTAATATLLKRAARRATLRSSELTELLIQRDGLAYGYRCPPGWSGGSSGGSAAFRDLIDELRPILIEMTGQLVIQHLEQIPEFREGGLLAPRKAST